MGARRRLFDLINGKLPSWGSATVRYEGFVSVLDTELDGTVRFAKKLGHPLPVWVVDNTTTISANTTTSASYIDVVANPWIKPLSRIRIDGRYDVTVSDVSSDGTRIYLPSRLETEFFVGTEVELFYHPVTVIGNYAAPLTTFVVHSDYTMYRGDVLVLSNTHEVELSSAVKTGMSPDGKYVYLVTLSEPQEVSAFDQGILGLRAYPAYESSVLLTPNQPFVWDRLSGVFYEDMEDVREVDTIILRDDASDELLTLNSGKNTHIYRTPVPVDALLFGRRMEGVVKWDSVRKCVVLSASDLNLGYLRYPFAPPWVAGQAYGWVLTVEATGNAKFLAQLGEQSPVVTDIASGTTYTITVPLTQDVSELHLKVNADPSVQVYIRSWNLASDVPVRTVSHTTVAHVAGPWLWGSTGSIAKRALRLSDVTARVDLGGALSSGYLVG